MIKKIVASEFGPIGKEIEISFEADKKDKEEFEKAKQYLIDETKLFRLNYIYGPNNSGKSQLIKLIEFLKDIVDKGKNIFRASYLPNVYTKNNKNRKLELEKKETKLKYIFEIDKKTYIYELILNLRTEKILLEKLIVNEDKIFERIENRVEDLEIDNNIFYLTRQYEQTGGSDEINNLYNYIQSINFICQDRKEKRYENEMIKHIQEIKKDTKKINLLLKQFAFDFELEILKSSNGLEEKEQIYSKKNNVSSKFGMLESFGTKSFIPLLLEIIYTKGDTIIIDEIEIGLNFELLVKFVQFIQKRFPNKQFIVTTHSTELLEETLDKQQVYVTKIVENELRVIRAFDKKRIREEQNFRKLLVTGAVEGKPKIDLNSDDYGRD